MLTHNPTICLRDHHLTFYVGKGYKSLFKCPQCGRETYQHLSYLGKRNVVCDGKIFSKEDKA